MNRMRGVAGILLAGAIASAGAQDLRELRLYGRLHLGIDRYSAVGAESGSALAGRNRVFDVGSRLGVRGESYLGAGLFGWSVVYQIESGLNADAGNQLGQGGAQNLNTGFLASRDSFVGLRGSVGSPLPIPLPFRFTVGRQSAYWVNFTAKEFGQEYLNTSSPLASYAASGVMIGPVARESNTMQLVLFGSPDSGGFMLVKSYGYPNTAVKFENNQPQSISQFEAGRQPSDRFDAVTLAYLGSPIVERLFGYQYVLGLQLDYGRRQDVAGVLGRDFTGMKWSAALHFGSDRVESAHDGIGVVFQRLRNSEMLGFGTANLFDQPCNATLPFEVRRTGGGGAIRPCDSLVQNMMTISAWKRLGSTRNQVFMQYGRAFDAKGSTDPAGMPDSGARSILLGVRHMLTRRSEAARTWLYLSYNRLQNGRNNFVDYWGAGLSSASQLDAAGAAAPAGLSPGLSGADPRIIAFGLVHLF